MNLSLIGKRHPLSTTDFTPSSDSSSSSSQATTSTTTNQDVAASNSGIAVGAGASYVNTFNPDVAKTVSDVVDKVFNFAGNVVSAAGNLTSAEQAASAAALSAAQQQSNQAINNAQLGNSSIFTNPAVIFGLVGALGLVVYLIVKRK